METSKNSGEVLLLETPFLVQTGREEVKAYLHSKYSLGLLSLGSYIKTHSNLKVYLINMVKDRISNDSLITQLRKNPPSVVGVSLYSYNLSLTYKVICRIKQAFPKTHICVGGPHVSVFPKETIQLKYIDSLVLGDGELPFLEICKQLVQNGKLDQNYLPPGTYTKESLRDSVVMAPYMFNDLNSLPLPDLTLLGDYTRYRDFLSNKVMAILTTSRGCPNICHYCLSEKSRYRSFSVEYVIDVMRQYEKMGIEYIEFWDETFNPTRKRLEQFADALLKANLGLTWAIRGATIEPISLEPLIKLKKTGLRIIQFGIETGNERLLKYLNKKINPAEIKKTFDNCHKAGIRTVANLMINIPTQTKQEIIDDFKILQEIKPTYLSIGIYNWAPGTTHYENALRDKTLPKDFWQERAANPVETDFLVHPITETPLEEVYKLRDRFVYQHYFNLRYIYNYLKLIDFSEVKRVVSIALLMLNSKFILMKSQFKTPFSFSNEVIRNERAR